MPVRAFVFVLLALVATLALPGCHKRSSSRRVEVVPQEIVYTVQPFNESFVDGFEFDNDLEFATVDIIGVDVDGEFTVYLEDGAFNPVYEATFIGSGDQIVLNDVTDQGIPGVWYLEVTGVNLTTDLQVIVQPQ